MRIERFVRQFNWRFLLVRILVNAIALAITVTIVPRMYFVDPSIWNLLFLALMLGILNALVKPILQTLTLQFIFVTYGLVIVIVNTLILLLLSFLFPDRFAVYNLLWALVGGLVLGLLSSFLESLLGLTLPIVPDEPPQLRQQLEEQAEQVDWLTSAGTRAAHMEQVPAASPELPSPEPSAPKSGGPEGEQGYGGEDLAEPSGMAPADAAASVGTGLPEPSAPEPGVEPVSGDSSPSPGDGQSPPEDGTPESPAPPAASSGAAGAEATISADPAPAHQAQEEAKEDQS